MPLSFTAVLLDPSGQTLSLPLIAETPEAAVAMLQEALPALQLRGLFDRATLEQWVRTVSAEAGAGERYGAVMVSPGAAGDATSTFVPMIAQDEQDALLQLAAGHPGGVVNGVFPLAVLTGFLHAMAALEVAANGLDAPAVPG